MKVAIPISSGLPSDGGGYTFESEIVAALIEAAPNSNHEIWIFNLSENPISHIQNLDNLKIVNLHKKTALGFTSWIKYNALALQRKLANFKTKFLPISWQESRYHSAVMSHDFDFAWLLSPYSLIQSPALDVPFAITIWDLQHRLQPYFPEVSLHKEWHTREAFYVDRVRQATYIVSGTERGQRELERFYQIAPERVKILPFPTPKFALINRYKAGDCRLLTKRSWEINGIKVPHQYFFYPAQFWPHKNHFTLLKALAHLHKKYQINLSVILTGSDKGNATYVKALISQFGLEQNVYLLGFVSQTDLVNLYQHALALTFPTYFGPDNLPPLEAFALGCPVIASNVPGASEQLGDAALLVQPNDADQLAIAMKSVYENPTLRQKLVDSGLKRATRWTSEHYVQKILSALDDFSSIRYCWPSS